MVAERRKGEGLQDCISRKISANIKEGKPRDQAIAIAHRQCGTPPPKGQRK